VHDRVMTYGRALDTISAALLIFTCGLAVAGQQSPAAVSPTPLKVPAYIQEIDRWAAALAQAQDHPQNVSRLLAQVPPNWQVMVDAQPVKVPTDWLRSGLAAAEKNPKGTARSLGPLRARLQAIEREAQALAAEPRGPDASAPGKLRAILSRPEFRQVHGPTWWDRLWQRFQMWLDSLPVWQRFRTWLKALLGRLVARLTGDERIAWFARLLPWAILICAAGGLLAWMIRQLLRRSSLRILKLGIPQPAPVQSWPQMTEAARKAATTGAYREAIRLAYLAAIHRLGDLKFWQVDPTRTHREYLRMVRPEQAEYAPLALLTRQFELTWYGTQPATPAEFETVAAQLERLGCA